MMATTLTNSGTGNNPATSSSGLTAGAPSPIPNLSASSPFNSLFLLQQQQQQQQLLSSSKLELSAPGKLPYSTLSPPEREEFCIRWKGFHGNIVDCLGGVRSEEEFVDVTLACESGGRSQAHKLVLASCSPYFRRILKELSEEKHPIIILNDVQPDILSALMTYMYKGEVYVAEERLPSFFKTAASLQIKGIAENQQLPVQSQFPSLSLPLTPHPLIAPPPLAVSSSSLSSHVQQLQQQHPVGDLGDLSLLAAAATQRPLATTPLEDGLSSVNITTSTSPPSCKRRKTMPRRIDVAASTPSYKIPKVVTTSFAASGGSLMPNAMKSASVSGGVVSVDLTAASAAEESSNTTTLKSDDFTAMNLSLRPDDSVSTASSAAASAATTAPMAASPAASNASSTNTPDATATPKVDYAARAGLINIPNPNNFASHHLLSNNSAQKSADTAKPAESPTAADATSPSSPSPLALDMSASAASPASAGGSSGHGNGSVRADDEDKMSDDEMSGNGGGGNGEHAGQGEGGLLLPVNANTTPEQMAALLGPSWKSRQPRLCQYCQRMFSNKFNLKQVRRDDDN